MASTSTSNSTSTRSIHSTTTKNVAVSADYLSPTEARGIPEHHDTPPIIDPDDPMARPPLSILPLTAVLRSLGTTTISSSPLLLPPSLAIMSLLAHTTNPLLSPDRNPLLRVVLKNSFYAQFCAGENPREVQRTIDGLKGIGFSGVILGYAREVVLTEAQTKDLASCGEGKVAEECIRNEIIPWAAGTLETVRLAQPGDYVALKFTGAGRQALYALSERLPPSPALADAIDKVCKLASERGVRLLFDAEQTALQAGIDDWTMTYMRRCNTADEAVVFNTYQAYLKSTPSTLSRHLAIAQEEGFALGVKLVRGAYLGSDPREVIHDTKADTDAAYDGIADALLRQQWNATLAPSSPESKAAPFPEVNMVLASHNAESVRKARHTLRSCTARTEVAFAQLQGMADEISCELVGAAQQAVRQKKPDCSTPRTYKYLVWGSTGECMKYLLRRAHENRDAVQRTRSGRDAMRAELWRRMKAVFGLA